MKAIRIVCVLMLISVSLFSQGLSRKEIRRQADSTAFSNLIELINTRKFEFTANQVLPQSSPSRMLTTDEYSVVIKQDSVFCDLPYFGRAYNISPAESGGFHFAEKLINYKIDVDNRKLKIEVDTEAKTNNDFFKLHFTIYGKKSASLSVISNNRSGISYLGNIEVIEQK